MAPLSAISYPCFALHFVPALAIARDEPRANQGRSPQCSPLVERLQRPWWALTELPGESGGKCRGFNPIQDLSLLQLWAELRTSHVHSSFNYLHQ